MTISIWRYNSGTNDKYSDFDCMIIVDEIDNGHDDTVIDGIPLDCFVFSKEEVSGEYVEPFITLFDGDIIMDTDDIAASLKARVRAYVAEHPVIPDDEKSGSSQKSVGRERKHSNKQEEIMVIAKTESHTFSDLDFVIEAFESVGRDRVKGMGYKPMVLVIHQTGHRSTPA